MCCGKVVDNLLDRGEVRAYLVKLKIKLLHVYLFRLSISENKSVIYMCLLNFVERKLHGVFVNNIDPDGEKQKGGFDQSLCCSLR